MNHAAVVNRLISSQRPIARLRVGRMARRVRAAAAAPWDWLQTRLRPKPTRLVIVPPDLRTVDPAIAYDMLSGHFALGGKALSVGDASPFAMPSAPAVWTRALYSFAWLRHMTALENPDERDHARAIVGDFLGLRAWPPEAENTRQLARRLIALIAAAPYLLDGADAAYYRLFLKSLQRHARRAQHASIADDDPLARLLAGVALLHLALSTDRSEHLARRAIAIVARELTAQIAADGGHIGRNPETPVSLLFDLIPLRQCFVRRGVEPPAEILNAIDRMLAMVRHMRHADGALAAFNGAGGAPRDLLAMLIAYGDAASPASPGLRGGYARLVSREAVALIDAAPPGPIAATASAHAGCLSFEFSSDGWRWIVNCGSPRDEGSELSEAVRTTIAHSTATLANATSSVFAETPTGSYLAGPTQVAAELADDGRQFTGSHNGYQDRFGVIHQRALELADDGGRVIGRDLFIGDATVDHLPLTLRFHIHPAIDARLADDDSHVLLVARDGAAWRFVADEIALEIEDSIFLGDGAPRRTMQIVVRAAIADRREIVWMLERVAQGRGREDA